MHKYKLLGKKGEGAFSEVIKAQDIRSSKFVAIKCMKNHFDNIEQVHRLREIQAVRRLSPHPNVIKLYEVLYDRSSGRLALVFELMEMNVYELIRDRRQYLAEDKILHYMYQLIKGLDHMHKNGIFHRDIKPENVLINGDALKLADFGSCRGIYAKQPFTEYISTRWYRAPECLLTDGYYNYKMDMWSAGCVFFEVMSLYPLFPGNNELDQIHKIHNILGTPPASLLLSLKKHGSHMDYDFPAKVGTGVTKLLPHVTPDALDLLTKLLAYNPDDRLSAKQALKHPYFREIRELDRRLRKASSLQSTMPLGDGGGDDDDAMSETRRSAEGLDDGGGVERQAPRGGESPARESNPSAHGGVALDAGSKLPALPGQHKGAVPASDGGSSMLPSLIPAGTKHHGLKPTKPEERKVLPKLAPIGRGT